MPIKMRCKLQSQGAGTCRAAELRAQAVQVLSHALGNDQLAAEYLLLQLLSR